MISCNGTMQAMILEDKSPVGRSHALDGLRGFAAAAVVFYHAILHNDLSLINRVLYPPLQVASNFRDALTKLALVLLNGETAVYVFFVLSGAVLCRSLERRNEERWLVTCMAFSGARILRLYPPLIACLVLYYAMGMIGIPGYPQFQFWQVIENGLLLKISMHGPSATIQAEVLVIPFILAAWLLRRYLGLPGLVMAFIYAMLALEFSRLAFNLPNMHAYLFAFMAGMLASEPLLRPLIQQAPASSWWLALVVLIFCRTFHPHSSLIALVSMGLSAAFLVAGLLYGQRGSLAALLEGRCAQALGRISFSLYLLNVPVLYLLWAFTDAMTWTKTYALEAGLLVGLISLLLTWPLAWISERWIERPSVAWGRKFSATVLARFGRPSAVPVAT